MLTTFISPPNSVENLKRDGDWPESSIRNEGLMTVPEDALKFDKGHPISWCCGVRGEVIGRNNMLVEDGERKHLHGLTRAGIAGSRGVPAPTPSITSYIHARSWSEPANDADSKERNRR